MKFSQILAGVLLTLTPALALPSKRQTCVDICGGTCYWDSDISAAVNQGYSLYSNGQTEGSGRYPHTYYDNEGFSFVANGPYLEFPILSSFRVYSGGSPGPDRVVFNTNGDFAGVITHTGAGGNNFLQCDS